MLALVAACAEAVLRTEVPSVARALHEIDPQPWLALNAAVCALNERAHETLLLARAERLSDSFGDACALWQSFMLDRDEHLMYEFRWEVGTRWCQIRLLEQAFLVFVSLAELAADEAPDAQDMRMRTGDDLLSDHPRRNELLVDAHAEPLCRQPASGLLNNLLHMSRMWPQLHYCEALERYVDALLLGVAHVLVYADVERVHDVESFRVVLPAPENDDDDDDDAEPPPVRYMANRKLITYMALVFRDLYRELATVERYAGAQQLGDPAHFACDAAEYARCVAWLHETSEQHVYEEAPALLTDRYPEYELLPGEFNAFYADNPHTYRSVAQVLQVRRANYRKLLDQAYESPELVILRELDAHAGKPPPVPQSTHMRFALAAHLELVMKSAYPLLLWSNYMVHAHEYVERVGELDGLEPNEPVLVHLFHGWQLLYNGKMYMFNDLIAAFVAWLRAVRDMMHGAPAIGVDLNELCARVLEQPAVPAVKRRQRKGSVAFVLD